MSRIFVAVAVLLTFAVTVATANEYSEWSPIQTRSDPVSFDPEFFGQHSNADYAETVRAVTAIRKRLLTRRHQAQPEGSPFASPPEIASFGSDDSQ
jgi:hypothetical protein